MLDKTAIPWENFPKETWLTWSHKPNQAKVHRVFTPSSLGPKIPKNTCLWQPWRLRTRGGWWWRAIWPAPWMWFPFRYSTISTCASPQSHWGQQGALGSSHQRRVERIPRSLGCSWWCQLGITSIGSCGRHSQLPIREPMEETCLFSFSVKKATKVTIRQKQFSCRRALGCFATNKRRCLQNLLARLMEVRRRGYWLRDLYNLDPI